MSNMDMVYPICFWIYPTQTNENSYDLPVEIDEIFISWHAKFDKFLACQIVVASW